MPSSIQARLRLSPSRCASLGSVGSVTTPGSSQSARPSRGSLGRKPSSQRANSARRQHPPHQVGLAEAGREEVLARRLVVERAGAIAAVEVARSGHDERLHLLSLRPRAPSRGRDRARTRSGCARRSGSAARAWAATPGCAAAAACSSGARFADQACASGSSHSRSSAAKLQKPREPVRPLEADAALAVEVGHLRRDVARP